MIEDKKVILKKITTYLEPIFLEYDFQLKRKSFFEKNLTKDLTLQYEILLNVKPKGSFYLALRLNILEKVITAKVNSILLNVMNDERFYYPPNFDDKIISRMKKERTSSKWIYGITDWRFFKPEKEELSEFNKKFNIWLASFNNLDAEIPDWQSQLKKSVEFAQKWFKDNATEEIFLKKTRYPSLILLAENGDKIRLENRYKEIHQQSNQHEIQELELFWEYLKKEYKY